MSTTDRRFRIDTELRAKEGVSLDEFVTERRASGSSWARISRELFRLIDVEISYETLRAWFAELERKSA